MRLCYIADANSVHTHRIVRHFARGNVVEVVSPNLPEERSLRVMEAGEGRVHYVGPMQTGSKVSLSFAAAQLRALRKTRSLIRKFAPDVVHCLYLTDCGLYGALSGFHPLMVFAMGSDILLDPARSPLHRSVYRYVLSRADLVHTGTEHAVTRLKEDGGRPSAVRFLPFGIDLGVFSPRPPDPELLKRLDLNPEHRIVVSTRSLNPVYSVETLIRAIPLVLGEIPECRFVVAGSGSQADELRALAEELGVSDALRFVGKVCDVERYLNLAELFVSTSLSDVFPCSILEAMACAKPLVVTDLPGVGELVTDRRSGRLFSRRDHLQLAACVVETLRDPAAMKVMGRLNRRLVEEKGDLAVAMREMEEAYRRLLPPGRAW